MRTKVFRLFALVLILTMLASPVGAQNFTGAPSQAAAQMDLGPETADTPDEPAAKASHRLIVELRSPPLVQYAKTSLPALLANGKLDTQSAAAQAYINQLAAEQAAFVANMQQALPDASVDYYVNELQNQVPLTYQITFNGLTIDPGSTPREVARKILGQLPDVKAVHFDFAHTPDLYASLPLINAAAAWNNPVIGGMANAGAGIKFASMDGGAHKDAPMFDGTGYSYPPGYPPNGLGLTANNNGKIIASRVYFRSWDPPSPGDENPWPGVNGTPHGTHTTSTAVGNQVEASYLGITRTLSGVAPAAWIMSYRVFYNSITNDGSFYNAEGVAALEDIVQDGADVLNNSWGGGPGSVGGQFDAIDNALRNVVAAGTFVSMSTGNAGPGLGTSDHPSDDYISAAASTSGGAFAAGSLRASAPTPVPSNLEGILFQVAAFGAGLSPATLYTYNYVTAASVDPSNTEGCNAWPAGTFTGVAAVISRGTCEFGVKVLNAENAGADFVVVHNNSGGGEDLISMGAGAVGNLVTIPSIFIGYTGGVGLTGWYTTNGALSEITIDTSAFFVGNQPDVLANFSSRGPGVGNTLKPDITAPGVNILAQGYTPGVTGEARHLGWGEASGTSMASPHVAGSAVLLRQIHPTWSNAEIKSALMSTSKYLDVFNADGSHAQPLDMGAGRLDLTNAADPGVFLDPPSVSFGQVISSTVAPRTNQTESMHVTVTSVASATETYSMSVEMVSAANFTGTTTAPLPGFSVDPAVLTLGPGESAQITVTINTADGMSFGDNQGFIVMDGVTYDAHLPTWVRLTPLPTGSVLLIDNDGSSSVGFPNFASVYINALDNLGIPWDYWNADANFGFPTTVPDAAFLAAYPVVIHFTGQNFYPNGFFTVSTALTDLDMDILTEYANQGGVVFSMGQDLASVLNSTSSTSASYFYSSVLGGTYLQDSVTGFTLPSQPIVPIAGAPEALAGVSLDLSGSTFNTVTLTGAEEAPTPVETDNVAEASFAYNIVTGELDYSVTVTVNTPITVTASHIHDGGPGVAGPVLYPLFTTPTYVTDTLTFGGSVVISVTHEADLLNGDTYINVHSSRYPAGELRAQVDTAVNGDGSSDQYFIDEIATDPFQDPDSPETLLPYAPLLKYPGAFNMEDGVVATSHRDQPTLERSGITYLGRSIYTTFGLEGVNNGLGSTTREELLSAFMDWAMDEPSVTIMDITPNNESNLTMFEATLTSNLTGVSGVSYRWDFGDGSSYTQPYESDTSGHTYAICGTYTVRVEATDTWGNKTIGELEADVTHCGTNMMYLPFIAAPP